jgi:hypothetical protein
VGFIWAEALRKEPSQVSLPVSYSLSQTPLDLPMTQQLKSEHLAQAHYSQFFLISHASQCQLLTSLCSDPHQIPHSLSS